jgi:hypothetical protein
VSSTMDCLVSAVGERPLGLSDSEDLGCIVSATVGERPLGMKEKWVEDSPRDETLCLGSEL